MGKKVLSAFGRRVAILPAWTVCDYRAFRFTLGYGAYSLGLAWEGYGLRITLVFWHICIHWRRGTKPCSH